MGKPQRPHQRRNRKNPGTHSAGQGLILLQKPKPKTKQVKIQTQKIKEYQELKQRIHYKKGRLFAVWDRNTPASTKHMIIHDLECRLKGVRGSPRAFLWDGISLQNKKAVYSHDLRLSTKGLIADFKNFDSAKFYEFGKHGFYVEFYSDRIVVEGKKKVSRPSIRRYIFVAHIPNKKFDWSRGRYVDG